MGSIRRVYSGTILMHSPDSISLWSQCECMLSLLSPWLPLAPLCSASRQDHSRFRRICNFRDKHKNNKNLTRIPVLAAVNTVIAIAMPGLIGMIARILRPASGRAYPTRFRPNSGIVIRVEIADCQNDAGNMLTSVSRELIRRPNSCTTHNLRIAQLKFNICQIRFYSLTKIKIKFQIVWWETLRRK